MSDTFVGEIRLFAGNFAPLGWQLCNGQLLPISENEVLFQLIGTTYGGDGESTFQLPDLQSRVPIHMGTLASEGVTFQIGEKAGVEQVTLTAQQMPIHKHTVLADTEAATSSNPAQRVLASAALDVFVDDVGSAPLAAASVSNTGNNLAHDNVQPSLAINFIISLYGIFPSQT